MNPGLRGGQPPAVHTQLVHLPVKVCVSPGSSGKPLREGTHNSETCQGTWGELGVLRWGAGGVSTGNTGVTLASSIISYKPPWYSQTDELSTCRG